MSKDPKDEISHRARIEAYKMRVDLLYNSALKEFAKLVKGVDYDPEKPFDFKDFPATKKKLAETLQNYASGLQTTIVRGTTASWYAAMKKADSKQPQDNVYTARNKEALQAFQNRSEGGLNLSKRVWNYTEQFEQEVQLAISSGLIEGKSAAQIARSLKANLNEPDKVFRRVRDKHGVLQLSKNAKAYHPGQGVYRSSHKNALRLAANEINDAYRSADHYRWQNDKSVIGFEVKLSNRHVIRDICDDLKGKYPKDFKYRGWHVRCLCYAIPIVMNDDDYDKVLDAEMEIEPLPAGFKPDGLVTDVPSGFKDWVKDNAERVKGWKSQPYFIRDNFKDGKVSGGLKFEVSKGAKKVKSDEQKADIQARWNARAKGLKLNDVISKLENAGIEYNEVKGLPGILGEAEIIARVGGGDLTKGSCSSLAFAYAGNKSGFEVYDFRDGTSRFIFSKTSTIAEITEKVGGKIAENSNDFLKANDLLKEVEEGKEYYFTCGQHAAIIRKVKTGFEYLELQSASSNGFKELTTTTLKQRFGAKKSHIISGFNFKTKDCLIDIDLLKNNAAFRKMLGYINTAESKQKKGVRGRLR